MSKFSSASEGKHSSTLAWNEQARQIVDALEALGIKRDEISTNTYIFKFPYKDYAVEMANHGISISGTVQKKSGLLDDRLEEALHRGHFDERTLALVKQYEFKRFSYGGNPVQLVQAVLRLADTPMHQVIAEQVYAARSP